MSPLPVIDHTITVRRSRLAFHWRGDRFELTALGERAATFSRAASASPKDSGGVSRTVNYHQPAWEIVDWDGDATRETPALLLGASDTIRWDFLLVPAALTLYVEFVENGTLAGAADAIAYLGNAGNSGARFWIDSTGSFYRIRHHNGTSEVTATLVAAPSAGQRVALRAVLAADGSVAIHQSINGAAETSASDATVNALAAAWSDTRLYLGSTGDTNQGNALLVRARVALGAKTAAQMQAGW